MMVLFTVVFSLSLVFGINILLNYISYYLPMGEYEEMLEEFYQEDVEVWNDYCFVKQCEDREWEMLLTFSFIDVKVSMVKMLKNNKILLVETDVILGSFSRYISKEEYKSLCNYIGCEVDLWHPFKPPKLALVS